MTTMLKVKREQGASVLIVLVLLTVMLLAGLTLARVTEVSTLAAGNVAYKEASVQASEVGTNTAFDALKALTNEDTGSGKWYLATMAAQDANGMPSGLRWDDLPKVVVDAYTVGYVVERMCIGALPVADLAKQCLVKQVPQINSAKDDGEEPLDPPAATQFRTTVRVTGPKGTTTFIQSLMTKG